MFKIVDLKVLPFAPSVAALAPSLYDRAVKHDSSITVLKAQIASDKLAHDSEMKDVKEVLLSIGSKLESIELSLQRGKSDLNFPPSSHRTVFSSRRIVPPHLFQS